ncbi:18591_t:CDS:2, partial [Dentiscutata erythropus]
KDCGNDNCGSYEKPEKGNGKETAVLNNNAAVNRCMNNNRAKGKAKINPISQNNPKIKGRIKVKTKPVDFDGKK